MSRETACALIFLADHITSSSVGANTSPVGSTPPDGLLNDTSVAVVGLDKGDKPLFFLESSGSIREALYTSSTGQWVADTNNIVASDAKNSTPLAAFGVNKVSTWAAIASAQVLDQSCNLLSTVVMS